MTLIARFIHRGFDVVMAFIGAYAIVGVSYALHSSLDGPDALYIPPERADVLALMDPFSESGLRRD